MSTLPSTIHPWTSLRLAIVVSIALVLAVGCGSLADQTVGSSGAPAATPTSSGAAAYVGLIPRAVSYGGDTGIRLAVPPTGASPSVSWQAAASTCSTCGAGAPLSVSLALATELQAGQANPDGSITPVMDNTLVYVLSQSLRCSAAGPSGATPAVSGTYPCVRLSFVDARSGKAWYAVDGPDLWDPAHVHP